MNSHQPHRSRKLIQRLPVITLIMLLMVVLGFVFANMGTAVAETTVLPPTSTSAGLVSYWPFDDGTGSTATNSITAILDGSLNGGASWSTDVAPLLDPNPYAIALDGSTGFVEIPDDDAIDFDTNQDFTVAFWTKPAAAQNPTGSNADNAIIEKWSEVGGYPYVVRYINQLGGANAGKISVARYDANVDPAIFSTGSINDGSYHHVAMVRGGGSSGTITLYIDGVLQATIADTVSQPTTNSSPLFVGKRGNNINYYSGLVDDLRIYNSALTSSEVAYLGAGCPDFPVTVATEAALNSTITCFNSLTTAGNYKLTLTADINLTASTTAINNSTAGVELHIDGDGHTVDGQDQSGVRPFEVAANTVVTLSQITLTGGNVGAYGGGLRNAGFTTIQNSTIANNNGNLIGGGIYNNGTMAINSSTISGNQADYGGGVDNEVNMTITNSTISGNQAQNTGGGINSFGTLTVTNITLSDNGAPNGGGIYTGAALNLINSVIANSNSGGDCKITGAGTVSAVYSLIEDSGASACNLSNGTNNNIIGQDPNLDTLQDNGGPTHTLALLVGSPAIDTADDSTCAAVPVNGFDQRGVVRPFGPHCDIGAFEFTTVTQPGPDFVVNTAADTDDDVCDLLGQGVGNQDCTLREAINAANANADGSVITFAGDYTLTLSSVLPDISTNIIIDGAGQAIAVDGDNTYRIFYVNSTGDLSINALTMQNGYSDSTAGIDNLFGVVTVSNSLFRDNNGGSTAGAIHNYFGSVIISNSTFYNNSSGGFSGGVANIGGSASINNATFSGNSSGTATIYTIAGGCFTEKAQILMADGHTKSVAEIGVGDQVLSYDFASGQQVVHEVTDVFNYSVDAFLIINDLEVTREHPFAIGEDEWIMAGELKIGDRILGSNGWTTVTSIAAVEQPVEVYNFTVDGTHSYYVSDGTHTYLAHNKELAANAGEVTLTNSIISDNIGPDCLKVDLGTFTGGNNLLDDYASGDCAAISNDAVTGLASTPDDHGGPTNTIALLAPSNALGAGNGLSCETSDQRGVARPQGVACDVGAYEFWGVGITAVTTTDASLDWNNANSSCTYDIFESTTPYFAPTNPATYTTVSLMQALTGKLGTVGTNYFYINRAACGGIITAYSNEVGEFDFTIVPGN